jgi:hypothetical protein
LANGLRERGELSFSYTMEGKTESPHFTAADGVVLRCRDAFTVEMKFNAHTVTFHLHQLPQTPPPAALMRSDEQFLERTCDDSGLQFYLMYHRTGNFFFWLLDNVTPGNYSPLGCDLQLETRTDFVFHVSGERRLLVGVKRANVQQNTAFDGPFDQLADNYALASRRQTLLEKAVPECAGRIDAWGNYLDTAKPKRVALVPYFIYHDLAELEKFMIAKPADALLERYVSRQGR